MPRSWDYKRVRTWVFFLVVVIGRDKLAIHVQPLLNGETITDTKVTDYRGKNTSLYDNSEKMYLQWLIEPKNATLYFTKCFHGYKLKPENYFFTYAFTIDRVDRQKGLGNRTSHSFWYEEDKAVFQLNISQPRNSDAGVYTCLLHAAGTPQERTARLSVKRVRGVHIATTVASLISSSGYQSSDQNYGASHKGEENSISKGLKLALSVVSVIFFLVLVVAIPTSIHFCGENGAGNSLESSAESLNKEQAGEGSGTKVTDCVTIPLCHRSEDSGIPSQDMGETIT